MSWSPEIVTRRADLAKAGEGRRERLGNPARTEFTTEPTRTPYGPVRRTADGGALVACLDERRSFVDMGPGRYTEFSSSGWAGTTGIRWSSYTRTQSGMTVLQVPPAGGGVSIASEAYWPHTFDGTRYTGN